MANRLEAGILCCRKPRGKKLSFMMGCGGSEASGSEYIRRDMPRGAWVYVWMDDASGEQRHFSIVPERTFNGFDRNGKPITMTVPA